jgi:hypothetical protein
MHPWFERLYPAPTEIRYDSLMIPKWLIFAGATRRIRTGDLLITNQLLYQLS